MSATPYKWAWPGTPGGYQPVIAAEFAAAYAIRVAYQAAKAAREGSAPIPPRKRGCHGNHRKKKAAASP